MTPATLTPPSPAELADWEESQVENRERQAKAGRELALTMMVRTYVLRVDEGLVLASWARQIRKLPPFRQVSGEEFKAHTLRLERLLQRCPPVIACEPKHPEQVFGWVCAELQGDDRVLHFVYVRNTWRRKGIARYLLELSFAGRMGEQDILYTHRGRSTPHLETKWRLRYEPGRMEAP
jgi:GNAT superfamily N-acetyltransferase